MYCKQEPDETLIMIITKSEWTPQLRDKSLLRAERRSCNSNFRLIQVYLRASTECQSLVLRKSFSLLSGKFPNT